MNILALWTENTDKRVRLLVNEYWKSYNDDYQHEIYFWYWGRKRASHRMNVKGYGIVH